MVTFRGPGTSDEYVRPGWLPLLATLERQLDVITPDLPVLQIKEKFGGLRYYVDHTGLSEEQILQVDAAINAAEDASLTTCEECGLLGDTRANENHWLRTLCPSHHTERETP